MDASQIAIGEGNLHRAWSITPTKSPLHIALLRGAVERSWHHVVDAKDGLSPGQRDGHELRFYLEGRAGEQPGAPEQTGIEDGHLRQS